MFRKVGARRVSQRTFPHSPLRTGRARFRASGSPGIGDFPLWWSSALLSSEQLGLLATPGLHRMISNYLSIRTSLPCRPSPCTRLSRAPTTMAAPTLAWCLGGLHPSARKPPTFILIRSASWCRQRLPNDPSHASWYPERIWVQSGSPYHPLGWFLRVTRLGNLSVRSLAHQARS
jgi:hypothetical protein